MYFFQDIVLKKRGENGKIIKKGEAKMRYIISPESKQYKANLHCHSTLSDGKKTPEQLKRDYKAHGYSVLAITDHERPYDHSELSERDFLLLTGYEAYIRPSKYAVYDPFKPELHINLFAKDAHNTTYICYNDYFDKYTRQSEKDGYIKVGNGDREYTVEYVNEFLKTARENGYICAYNHPVWSLEDYDRILAYDGFFSIEMCNYSSYLINPCEYNSALYDRLLRSGKSLFCHSTDDNHNISPDGEPGSDSYGGFTMILSEDLSYGSVISALEKGAFYSSMGPVIKELTVDDGHVTVKTSDSKQISAIFGGKSSIRAYGTEDAPATSLSFDIPRGALYFRINVMDFCGRFADTHAYEIE